MKRIRVLLLTSSVIGTVISVIAQVHSDTEDESSAIPVIVRRRPSSDFYTILQQSTTQDLRCDVNNATYLVKENQCISDNHLFSECSFIITPTGEFNTPRLYFNIEMEGTITIAQTTSTNDDITNVIITFRSTSEQVNSSHCHISSLEVYRGRKQAIEISYEGFFLSENGTIKIHIYQLVYSPKEYLGELYRMNLSCSGGGLPESGCLFFKVFGAANISEAKFNCLVPGTLPTNSSECVQIATNSIYLTTLSPTSPTLVVHDLTSFIINTSTLPPTSFFDISNFESSSITGITGILVIIPVVGGVTILNISIVMVCVVVWFRYSRKRQLNSISSVVAQPQNQDAAMTLQPSDGQRNPAYSHFGPIQSSQAAFVSGNYHENPAYNIDTQPSSHQEPTYEVIPSDMDGTPRTVQGTQNVNCNQNPVYVHLGVHVQESFQADPTSPRDYSQNPAYGIHPNPNN